MTIRDIAADFRVDPDLYCEFLRTYDAFAPGGRLSLATLGVAIVV